MRLLEEAKDLGMMEKGWAWIVSDGTTVSSEPLYERNVTDIMVNVSRNKTRNHNLFCTKFSSRNLQILTINLPSIIVVLYKGIVSDFIV